MPKLSRLPKRRANLVEMKTGKVVWKGLVDSMRDANLTAKQNQLRRKGILTVGFVEKPKGGY